MEAYEANSDIFYRYRFVCVITYFVFVYWAMWRKKAAVAEPRSEAVVP